MRLRLCLPTDSRARCGPGRVVKDGAKGWNYVLSDSGGESTVVQSFEEAWQEIVDSLAGYIRRHIRDAYDAEDVLQDVFCKAFGKLGDLRDPRKISPWLYRIARNAVADYHRRRKLEQKRQVLGQANSGEATPVLGSEEPQWPPSRGVEAELATCLSSLLNQLPDGYRAALVLTALEGLTQKDLAAKLGLSLSGAKSRVQRARSKLKKLLFACCDVEFDRRGSVLAYRPRDKAMFGFCACPAEVASETANPRLNMMQGKHAF